jgi:hypothetical protein
MVWCDEQRTRLLERKCKSEKMKMECAHHRPPPSPSPLCRSQGRNCFRHTNCRPPCRVSDHCCQSHSQTKTKTRLRRRRCSWPNVPLWMWWAWLDRRHVTVEWAGQSRQNLLGKGWSKDQTYSRFHYANHCNSVSGHVYSEKHIIYSENDNSRQERGFVRFRVNFLWILSGIYSENHHSLWNDYVYSETYQVFYLVFTLNMPCLLWNAQHYSDCHIAQKCY